MNLRGNIYVTSIHFSYTQNNISGVDLADMKVISKYKERCRFLPRVVFIFSKYAWVVPMKDKKRVIITKAFKSF